MTESVYRKVMEDMLAGKQKKLSGVTHSTASKGLQKAKRKLYEEAAALGYPLPAKEIKITVQADGTLLCVLQDNQRGFSRKLKVEE